MCTSAVNNSLLSRFNSISNLRHTHTHTACLALETLPITPELVKSWTWENISLTIAVLICTHKCGPYSSTRSLFLATDGLCADKQTNEKAEPSPSGFIYKTTWEPKAEGTFWGMGVTAKGSGHCFL